MLKNRNFLVIFSLVILASFLLIRIIVVSAAGPADTSFIEAENGTLAGAVSVGADANASNGHYVTFLLGATSTPTVAPTATPTPTPTATATATPTPTPTPAGLVITNLTVFDTSNATNFSIQSNIQIGNTLYGDRTHTVRTLPANLVGSSWIRTANNSKTWNAGSTLMSFNINKTATVYVGIDMRLLKFSWMDATWVNTGQTMTDLENGSAIITFNIYSKTFPAGTVSLGPNAGPSNSDMYTVIVQ